MDLNAFPGPAVIDSADGVSVPGQLEGRDEALRQEDAIVTNKDKMWKEYINILPPTETHLFYLQFTTSLC